MISFQLMLVVVVTDLVRLPTCTLLGGKISPESNVLEITRKREFGDHENMIKKQERENLGILKNDKNGGK